MLSTDGGGTHWFQAWHRTRPPAVRWPGTETGSGLCGSLWRIFAYLSPRSHCLSTVRWTCHLRERKITGRERDGGESRKVGHKRHECGEWRARGLTSRILPIVSMVSLSSMRSWALGMSMCILNVCCCLFTVSGVRVFLLRRLMRKIHYFSAAWFCIVSQKC